jgi:HK97 family phage major capsid protein
MNPRDVTTMQLIKTSGTASSGEYIWVDPFKAQQPQVWGLPIVSTVAMTQGQFMVGAFQQAAAIWDRSAATVEVSREHESYWIKNMVAILCECRLALTVFRPLAIVAGGFPFGS